MPIRDDIVNWAIWESNYGEWKPSGEEMVKFFQTAGLTPPSLRQAQESMETMGSNVRVGNMSIAWCGIFACYVLRHWADLDVKWISGSGIAGKSVKKVYDYRYIRPGDVAVIPGKQNAKGHRLWHHFIVTAIDYGSNHLESVDGNSTRNQIVWHTNKRIRYTGSTAYDNSIAAYYQVLA